MALNEGRRVDASTIDRARTGDREAQAALLGGLQDLWFRFCVSQLGNADLARDATQETALRVLRSLSSFRGDSRVQTWSLGIALNVIRETRRGAIRQEPVRLVDALAGRSVEDAPDHPGADEIERMRLALDGLPDRQRQALVLRFFEELTVEETARVMQCAPGTIKATVHQALRAMRQRLSKRNS